MSTWLIRPAWLRTWHLALLEMGPQQGQDRHSSMLGSPWTLARQMGHQALLSQTGGSGTGMCSCASRSLLHRFTKQATPASRHTMTHTGEQMIASHVLNCSAFPVPLVLQLTLFVTVSLPKQLICLLGVLPIIWPVLQVCTLNVIMRQARQ